MNKFTKKSIVGILILLIGSLFMLSTSCVKEKDFDFNKMAQNQYESEWAIPIINKKYTLSELILDTMSYIVSDPNDQFLTVVYNTGDLWSFSAEDVVVIPDQSIDKTQNVTAPSSITAGTYWENDFATQTSITMGTYAVDSMQLKDGSFILAINTNINHSGQLLVTLPQVTNGHGIPMSFTVDLVYNGGTEMASGSKTVSLVGYKMILQTGNNLNINYKIRVLGDSYPFNIPTYNIQMNTQFTGLKYKYMVGYFGQFTENFVDTTSIRLFKTHYENSLVLSNLRAQLFMKNSFGVPVRFQVNNFTINNNSGTLNSLLTPGTYVDGPYPTLSQFGQTITKHDTIPLQANLISISPKYMVFNAIGTLNPDNNPAIKNFIRDDSRFSVDARLELPLEGKIMSFGYRDTLEFHFENIDAIQYSNFRLYVENSFPINGLMQVYFADSAYQKIDSLIENPQTAIFPAATTGSGPAYYTTSNGTRTMDILVNSDRIKKISRTKWLIVDAKLSSYNHANQLIRIYGNQYIYVILGTRMKLKANY